MQDSRRERSCFVVWLAPNWTQPDSHQSPMQEQCIRCGNNEWISTRGGSATFECQKLHCKLICIRNFIACLSDLRTQQQQQQQEQVAMEIAASCMTNIGSLFSHLSGCCVRYVLLLSLFFSCSPASNLPTRFTSIPKRCVASISEIHDEASAETGLEIGRTMIWLQ